MIYRPSGQSRGGRLVIWLGPRSPSTNIRKQTGGTTLKLGKAVPFTSKLKEKQWKKIFMVARASGKCKKNTAAVVSALPSPSQALVEVRDDDSDLADDSDV
jgi:hypothetical protein